MNTFEDLFRKPDVSVKIHTSGNSAYVSLKNPFLINNDHMPNRTVQSCLVVKKFIDDLINRGKNEDEIRRILRDERDRNCSVGLSQTGEGMKATYSDKFSNTYFKKQICDLIKKECKTAPQFSDVVKFNVELYKLELDKAYKNPLSYGHK